MKLDKEILHPSHLHKLKMEYTETPFICDGCKEAGIGLKYRCSTCDFDLHKICALAPETITHPFYKKCFFRFHMQPPGPGMRICDACRKDVNGFVYHCSKCGFDVHPCCANLPQRLDDGERKFHLNVKSSSACHRCGGKGRGFAYRSECKNYNLHVACVKEMLEESWQAMYLNLDKNKVKDIQMIPSLRGITRSHHGGRGRVGTVRKCCMIAAGALRIIISAILGDPTAIIAAVVGALIAK